MDLPGFVGMACHWQQCFQRSAVLYDDSTTLLRPYQPQAFVILSAHPVGSCRPYKLQTSRIARCINSTGHAATKMSAVGRRRQYLDHIAAIVIA